MGLRILVFDDDVSIGRLLNDALKDRGHSITSFTEPTQFPFFDFERCPCDESEPCADVLIADIVMPNYGGIDFIKRLKRGGCWPLVKGNVAVMSGFLTLHYMTELQDLGIQFMRKPFRLEEMYKFIDNCEKRISTESSA